MKSLTEIKTKQWKFLQEKDGRLISDFDHSPWIIGEWREVPPPKELCNGLNASDYIHHALDWVRGTILAHVECDSDNIKSENKTTWRRMRILRAWHWNKRANVKLALAAAKMVLPLFEARYPDDNRPRKAIEAAEAWLLASSNAITTAANAAGRAADAVAIRAAATATYAATTTAAYAAAAAAAADAACAAYAAAAAACAANAANAAACAAYATTAAANAANAANAAVNAGVITIKIHRAALRIVKTLKEVKSQKENR